jgi:hypothetical protein
MEISCQSWRKLDEASLLIGDGEGTARKKP